MQTILASQVFRRVLFIDELIYESFLRSVPQTHSRLALCPDPVETDHTIGKDDFRTRFGIPINAKVLGVFGEINSRKGVDFLIESFGHYVAGARDYLLLMGRHSPKVAQKLLRFPAARNIVSIDAFVTDDELISGINAVDVVAAVYRRHVGSASIVIRAAAAGKPVLGSDFGWIGHMIRKHGLGKVCNVSNGGSLVEGFGWAFNNPASNVEKATAFAKQNSVDCFIDVVRGLSGQKVNI
jgi:glycosyltransferase involved in cell wall biosynthesis